MRAAQHSPASRDLRRAPFDTPYRAVRVGRWESAHALRAVRQVIWLEAGSAKMALHRPGRAPGWCPIPPRQIEPVEITSGEHEPLSG